MYVTILLSVLINTFQIADTRGTKVSVSLDIKHAAVLTGSPEDQCVNADVFLPYMSSDYFPCLQRFLIQP